MRIGFSFFGSIYGPAGKVSTKDFRHCWPNIRKMLVDPFLEQGHEAKILFSCYPLDDPKIINDFFTQVKPDRVTWSSYIGSDAFTCKEAAFKNFEDDKELDVIIFTRSDLHWSKVMANENINFGKFNFLFPEKDWFETERFTCDNFYVFPQHMSTYVRFAMKDTYRFPRPQYVDTHALMRKLPTYMNLHNMHIISPVHETSDVNSYYTCCREGLPIGEDRMKHCHPEVAERFYNV